MDSFLGGSHDDPGRGHTVARSSGHQPWQHTPLDSHIKISMPSLNRHKSGVARFESEVIE